LRPHYLVDRSRYEIRHWSISLAPALWCIILLLGTRGPATTSFHEVALLGVNERISRVSFCGPIVTLILVPSRFMP